MVTKPIPLWERWFKDLKKRERAYWAWALAIILLNVFIALGLIAFMIFWFRR